MLKFLTHKLKTHSLNEDHLNQYKTDDHDSGTESDNENGDPEEPESMMESEADGSSGSSGSTEPLISTGTICSAASSPLASDYDHHSSEEELEVINRSSKSVANKILSQLPPCRQYIATGVATGAPGVPEKRKWSQVTSSGGDQVAVVATSSVMPGDHSSGSSDEEVQGLLAAMTTPVQFRSSPPSSVHKPGHRSLPPPPKLFHYGGESSATTLAISPRKRHRHTPRNSHVQRPCLDFEKMQQLKARAVTAWRHGGDHGAELSVFCW